jgi:hypothetical protein
VPPYFCTIRGTNFHSRRVLNYLIYNISGIKGRKEPGKLRYGKDGNTLVDKGNLSL